jgi:chitin disaccharide deacetylase
MLIVNADDLGRCPVATDRILDCHAKNRITSASAMVFMEDSERAAALAKASRLDLGLHINFTESFTGPSVPQSLRDKHERIRKFLRSSKYSLLIYNPFLRTAFREVFQAQADEFVRLYGHSPSRMDGHQHMHLSTNMLLDWILPDGMTVRRSFSFSAGEKSFFNRWYRKMVDRRLARRHRLADFFFAISQQMQVPRLQRVIELAKAANVELMTHPEVNAEFDYLQSDGYARAISGVTLGTYASL